MDGSAAPGASADSRGVQTSAPKPVGPIRRRFESLLFLSAQATTAQKRYSDLACHNWGLARKYAAAAHKLIPDIAKEEGHG